NWHDLASLRLLSDIAAGRLELRHEALDALPQVFSVTHLRALLIVAGALPARDENITRLHRHAAHVVADVADPEMRGVLPATPAGTSSAARRPTAMITSRQVSPHAAGLTSTPPAASSTTSP